MDFRIADTFTASLGRLQLDEQKAVKTTAFDLQLNPENPGHQFHKLDRAKDKNFWSVRVSRDIRLIVHRTSESLMLCYVGHHDDAYAWAERRKIETHPTTGAAQIVELRETIVEIPIERYVETPAMAQPIRHKPLLFEKVPKDELLGFGVPPEWIADVLAANEDSLLELVEHLPSEAAEALLELATGGVPTVATLPVLPSPFAHPDAQRRFRTVENVDELALALDFPWDRWSVFLHPAQKSLVERTFSGPARVAGSAGTGKTVVALHRAVFLAKHNPDARVLLTTFSDALANLLESKLFLLVRSEPKLAERIQVLSMRQVGERLYRAQFGNPSFADLETIRLRLDAAAGPTIGSKYSLRFLVSEWTDVVDAWQLRKWEEYRDVRRLGRKSRLGEQQRAGLWPVFQGVLDGLAAEGKITESQMFSKVTSSLPERKSPPYDFVVVDESQDISIAQLRFLAALGALRANALFFAGDLGQRIFQQPFSWLSQGVDVRGRSQTLKVNYRTSHQIRSQADRLLADEVADMDGIVETRAGTISLFNGPQPEVRVFQSEAEENSAVAVWLKSLVAQGVAAHETAIFVRSANQLDRAKAAVEQSGLQSYVLDELLQTKEGSVSVGTMHLAKGLEFRAVAVMACDDEILPLQARIESAADTTELEEVYNTERHLLYVACTRSRDHLLVTSAGSPSEFLDDLLAP